MSIWVDEEQKIFHLQSKDTSYIMRVTEFFRASRDYRDCRQLMWRMKKKPIHWKSRCQTL